MPLQENYQTISLRTTELESFHTCAFKHRYWKQEFANNDALLFGSLTHAVLQAFFFNEAAGMDTLDIICQKHDERCKTIYDYIALIEKENLRAQYPFTCTEFKCVAEIEFGEYLVILEGTIDAICKDSNGWFRLIDFKTSKAEWKPETYDNKIQKFIYPRLLAQMVGEDRVTGFDYLIFTKHVTPRLQVLKYDVDRIAVNQFMKDTLSSYCFALKNSMRNPKVCQVCFFCPVKDTCPLKQIGGDDSF